MSQSSSILHSSSQGPSMNACSSGDRRGTLADSNLLHFGAPVNSWPSHHTVPASSASRSVCDMGGSNLMYAFRKRRLMGALRSGGRLNGHNDASMSQRNPRHTPAGA